MVDWLQVGQTSGSGDTQILVRATQNDTIHERTSSLIVSGITKDITIPIRQYRIPLENEPLTFYIYEAGTVSWYNNSSYGEDATLSYSINGGDWQAASSSKTLSVVPGDIIRFRGENQSVYRLRFWQYTTAKFEVYGNLESIVCDDYDKSGCFRGLFSGCETMLYADGLVMPLSLGERIFQGMFSYCTSLITAPELPATILYPSCYDGMFLCCTSLTESPSILPATTLPNLAVEDNSYSSMFSGCTSLVSSPVICLTEVGCDTCYAMFRDCTSLRVAPELSATNLIKYHPETGNLCSDHYMAMFAGCTSLTTTQQELPCTDLPGSCYDGMFSGCTSLEIAPELPAETSSSYCYRRMFYNCRSLRYIKCSLKYHYNYEANVSTKEWIYGVQNTGTFIKPADSNFWTGTFTGVNGIPSGWTVIDA